MSIFSMFGSGALPLELMTPTEVDVTKPSAYQLQVQCNASDTFLIVETFGDCPYYGLEKYEVRTHAYLVSGGKLLCELYLRKYPGTSTTGSWTYFTDMSLITPDKSEATVDAKYLFSAPKLLNSCCLAIKLA